MVKTRTWALGIGIAIAALAVLSALLLTWHRGGTTVEIVQNGEVIREIDLSRVAEEYSFVIESADGGKNVVTVQPGRICVSDADCPDRICVERGWLTDEAAPIVCMPHKLMIRVKTGTADVDAVAQ